jgi:hypothetical protein
MSQPSRASSSDKIERARTVTSLDPGTAPAPAEERAIDLQQSGTRPNRRRTVRLAELAGLDESPEPPPPPVVIPEPRADAGHFSMPRSGDDWLRLAERVVGDWAATLRNALLLLLAFVAMVVSIGIALGVESAVAAAAVGLLVFLAGRRCGSAAS